MQKSKKIIALAVAVMLFALATPVFANGYPTPYLNNTSSFETSLDIDENGLATVRVQCRGYRGITSRIEIETKLEKLSDSTWVEVEGASWSDSSTLYYCSKTHTYQIETEGTYRVVATFSVFGTGGETDVFTCEAQAIY